MLAQMLKKQNSTIESKMFTAAAFPVFYQSKWCERALQTDQITKQVET